MRFKIFCDDQLDCNSARKRFSEYLDGMLSEQERVAIHEHLKFCDACSDELEGLREQRQSPAPVENSVRRGAGIRFRQIKLLGVLIVQRDECLPAAIQDFRLPRSTFVEIFPTIREERPPQSLSVLFPYVYALILFFLVVSSWEFAYRHTFEKFYNASNYVEVVAKI